MGTLQPGESRPAFSAFSPKRLGESIDWTGIRQLVIVFSDLKSEPEGELFLDHLVASKGTSSFNGP